MLRFAIDAHAIGQHKTGNEVYVRNLLRSFQGLDSHAEFLAYLAMPGADLEIPDGVIPRWVSRNPFVRLGWQMTSQVRRDTPALLHVQYTAPLACPVPVVVSVHDVSFLENPEFFHRARVAQLTRTVRATIARAAHVVTVSEFSRRSIERYYPDARGKTTVIPNAVSPHYRPMGAEVARKRIRAEFGIRPPYFLNVGDLQPRKNQVGLIQAFDALIAENPQLPHRLVLVGQNKWEAPLVRQAAERSRVNDRIHFTGYVNDDQLRLLYCAADAFLFPSFYEGFGIPILEAMACGCPVACSRTSAMPEVADGAAIFFDPHQPGDIVRAMRDLALDGEMRGRLGRLGQSRAAAFSWERAARQTLEVYYQVAGVVPAPLERKSARAAT